MQLIETGKRVTDRRRADLHTGAVRSGKWERYAIQCGGDPEGGDCARGAAYEIESGEGPSGCAKAKSDGWRQSRLKIESKGLAARWRVAARAGGVVCSLVALVRANAGAGARRRRTNGRGSRSAREQRERELI